MIVVDLCYPQGLRRLQASSLSSPVLLLAVLIAATFTLQGCDVPHVDGYVPGGDQTTFQGHRLPYWRKQPNYFTSFAPARVGYQSIELGFNSCMDPSQDAKSVCSGRGSCMPFNQFNPSGKAVVSPVFFCFCGELYGGPECQFERKRQSTAWVLALFGGPLSLDEFYLGNGVEATIKLCNTGAATLMAGLGFRLTGLSLILVAWLIDVVRIGSAPVHASDHRVANDLEPWAFAVFTILHFAFVAFAISLRFIYVKVTQKRTRSDYLKCYGAALPAKVIV